MPISEEQRAANDQRIADDIAKFGCHVISVFDPQEKDPTFSYSVGVYARTGAPEVIVIGVRPKLGHSMVNEYCRQVDAGMRHESSMQYADYLEGFNVYVEPAQAGLASVYMLGCNRYYKGASYPVVQLVYPTTEGIWPWEEGASEWFKANQPMLGRSRLAP